MHLRYLLHAALALPQLPFMARDGKRILNAVPKLPDASGPSGTANLGAGPPFRLLCIGESTMAGVGVATHAEGFAGTLATTLSQQLAREVHWKVYAKSGATARRLIVKVLPQIKEPEADLIVVATAGNDAFKLSTPWTFRQDLEDMIQRLQQRYPG
ncbi:MAG: GDSL-type esterase/lipase family protein, partial [Bacteroidota bacterium]